MKEISVQELKAWQDAQADFQLIDVREDYEYEQANLGGLHIPMATIGNNVAQIAKDKKVVIHCRSGKRSATVIRMLEQSFRLDNLYNLQGGILAYAAEIDDSLEVN